MNLDAVQSIVDAVLYEGYLLYPYRPSALKNRQRWTFGGVYPKAYSEAQAGAEPCEMQTECLLTGSPETCIGVRVGFLHLVERQPGELPAPVRDWPADAPPEVLIRNTLLVGNKHYYGWQEATERRVESLSYELRELLAGSRSTRFAFPVRHELEPLRNQQGDVAGVLVRDQSSLEGTIEMRAERLSDNVFRVSVRIANTTPMDGAQATGRERASMQALVSCHAILHLSAGEFVSLMDPPEHLRQAAAACRNIGIWPVLAGAQDRRDLVLASPIILYDYPEVAPESPGDFFDSTEMDEMLALRILTMTDDEKREMAAADERGRMLLERTEAMTPAQMQQLHGAVRGLRPVVDSSPTPERSPWEHLDALPRLACLQVGGVELSIGDHVRLEPRGAADIMDIALAGKLATIQAIERDFDNRVHVAVTVDDDGPRVRPGQDARPSLLLLARRDRARRTRGGAAVSKVLVACVGNIFLGDDGFGVEVARRLGQRVLPEGVELVDFGIRAVDLGYALEDGYDAVILVDASPQGGAPGRLYVIEPTAADAAPGEGGGGPAVAPHELSATAVLQMARSMGATCGRIVLVGCEPESFGTENDGEGRMGLSEPVAAAVDPALRLVESWAARLLQDDGGSNERWRGASPAAGVIHPDGERR